MVSCEALRSPAKPLEVADVINEVHHLVEEMGWDCTQGTPSNRLGTVGTVGTKPGFLDVSRCF